jgi:hypothetical protein
MSEQIFHFLSVCICVHLWFTNLLHFLWTLATFAGQTVQCITPAKQMQLHTGYTLPASQGRDLERLHEVFGVEYPDGNTPNRSALAYLWATKS